MTEEAFDSPFIFILLEGEERRRQIQTYLGYHVVWACVYYQTGKKK